MSKGDLNWIANYIWGIADDVLRDLYVRGKYRGRDPADDRAAPARRGAGGQQAGGPRHEGLARRRWRGRAGPGPAPGGRAGVLQHFPLHPEGPACPRQPPAAHRRLPGLPRRVLAQRAGHPRQLRVPQPDPAAVPRRRPGHLDREAHLARHQSEPRAGAPRRRLGKAPRARQPRHGHDSSRSWYAASTRRTTRRRASTGRRATRSG